MHNVSATRWCISGTGLLRQIVRAATLRWKLQTFYLTQSQHTDTGPASPSVNPIPSGAWHSSHWSTIFLSHLNGSTLKETHGKFENQTQVCSCRGGCTRPTRRWLVTSHGSDRDYTKHPLSLYNKQRYYCFHSQNRTLEAISKSISIRQRVVQKLTKRRKEKSLLFYTDQNYFHILLAYFKEINNKYSNCNAKLIRDLSSVSKPKVHNNA